MEAVCASCHRYEPYIPSAWLSHILFLNTLSIAGYPFAQDDLSMEEWLDLGILKYELETYIPDGKC